MNRIFARFPDETVQITSACRRKTGDPTFDGDVLVCHWFQIEQGDYSCETPIPRSGLYIPGFIWKPGMQKIQTILLILSN